MLSKAHLISHSRMSGSRWVITHHNDYLGREDLFGTVFLCVLATSSEYLLLLLDPSHFCPLLSPSLHEHHKIPKICSPDSSVGKEYACNPEDPRSIPGSGRSAGEGIGYPLQYSWASLVAQLLKNLPTMRDIWVQSLVGNNPWRKERLLTPATQYSGLENSMDYTLHGVAKSQTWLSDFHFNKCYFFYPSICADI